jgi:hypothetical protein
MGSKEGLRMGFLSQAAPVQGFFINQMMKPN